MTRAHPDLWYPIAALLSALRKLLHTANPYALASIAREARAQLAVITALIRRYIHILAAELVLPPPRATAPQTDHSPGDTPQSASRYLFPLIETQSRASGAGEGEDPPELQWALLIQAAERLVSVLANPAPHARRLARRFGTLLTPGLRDLAVPWHVIRRVGPFVDTLLMLLDQLARPQAWAGLDTT
ncbi:MAG: hypothetical protein RLO80_04490 [Hyphomonas sp.]